MKKRDIWIYLEERVAAWLCHLSWVLSLPPLFFDPGATGTGSHRGSPKLLAPLMICLSPFPLSGEMGKRQPPPPTAAGRIIRITGAGTSSGAHPGQERGSLWTLQVGRRHAVTPPCAFWCRCSFKLSQLQPG